MSMAPLEIYMPKNLNAHAPDAESNAVTHIGLAAHTPHKRMFILAENKYPDEEWKNNGAKAKSVRKTSKDNICGAGGYNPAVYDIRPCIVQPCRQGSNAVSRNLYSYMGIHMHRHFS